MVGQGSIYIDCLGGTLLTGCYDTDHPLSCQEEANARKEILRMAKAQMGSVATEYMPVDYLADTVDLGSFFPIHFGADLSPRPVPVPLYQLVYHDAVLNYDTEGSYGFYGSEYLLYVALYGMLPFSLEPISLRLSKALRTAYGAEMVNHRCLEPVSVERDGDGCFWTRGVQETTFADGTVVVANFDRDPYYYAGQRIAGRDFAIQKT
jgi:hypothetical protein